jgi:hypothetical protein
MPLSLNGAMAIEDGAFRYVSQRTGSQITVFSDLQIDRPFIESLETKSTDQIRASN